MSRGDPLEEVPTRSRAHSRLNRFSKDPRQQVRNNTYLASGPSASTASPVVLATAKTSLPVAREHSIPPLDFDRSELTLSSAEFLSPKSLMDNATDFHAPSTLNGTTASHRNTTPKGNFPAHQPIREQSSPAESHKSSPKNMGREQSAAAGSHRSILDQAEREQSATTGSHRSILNQAQWVELPRSELRNASSASNPLADGQVRHRVDRDDMEEAYSPGHVAVPENQDESSHSPAAKTLRRQLKQRVLEIVRRWPDVPADDELKRKIKFDDDDDDVAAHVRPDATRAQEMRRTYEGHVHRREMQDDGRLITLFGTNELFDLDILRCWLLLDKHRHTRYVTFPDGYRPQFSHLPTPSDRESVYTKSVYGLD
ncbi:MAG: hypothetical protein LQ337_003875 [Flavoplaca oasis]|nr:MAG: hypothetical protein LQ337_003875 [Flavoplaca oasis]